MRQGRCLAQGSFVGNNSWTSNLQVLVWQIDGMMSLNSTVFYSRNTSGSAPGSDQIPNRVLKLFDPGMTARYYRVISLSGDKQSC